MYSFIVNPLIGSYSQTIQISKDTKSMGRSLPATSGPQPPATTTPKMESTNTISFLGIFVKIFYAYILIPFCLFNTEYNIYTVLHCAFLFNNMSCRPYNINTYRASPFFLMTTWYSTIWIYHY